MSLLNQITDSALCSARENYPNHEGAKKEVLDAHTIKSIRAVTKKFAAWVQGRYTRRELFSSDPETNRAVEALQEYQIYLSRYYRKTNGGHLSPATVHTYLAYACTALGVSMAEIKKDKRTADTITRSRRTQEGQNRRGDREARSPKYRRLVAFQQAVGLRRGELARLTTEDLVMDESGYLCVRVRRGKGGKKQLQRILPAQEGTVVATMTTGTSGAIFSKAEMDNDIDLHGMRAAHGYECYLYYAQRLEREPEYAAQLRRELLARYDAFNPNGAKKHRDKFIRDISNPHPYYLRRHGSNYATAVRAGRPVVYNRLALMAVSVLHLSHWRLDVSVTNYILGGH